MARLMPVRGEVWWYESPARMRRPYLILTRSEAIPHLFRILAVPATRTVREIPTEVFLDSSDGMPYPCVLSLDNAELLRRPFFVERVTSLSPARMEQVCSAFAVSIAC